MVARRSRLESDFIVDQLLGRAFFTRPGQAENAFHSWQLGQTDLGCPPIIAAVAELLLFGPQRHVVGARAHRYDTIVWVIHLEGGGVFNIFVDVVGHPIDASIKLAIAMAKEETWLGAVEDNLGCGIIHRGGFFDPFLDLGAVAQLRCMFDQHVERAGNVLGGKGCAIAPLGPGARL